MWCTFIGYNSGEYYRINQKFGSTLKGDHRHCSKYFKFLLWRLHSEKEFFNINLRQIFWVSFVAFVKEVFFFFWEKSPIEFLSSFSKIFFQFDFQNVFVQMIFLLNLLPPLAIAIKFWAYREEGAAQFLNGPRPGLLLTLFVLFNNNFKEKL